MYGSVWRTESSTGLYRDLNANSGNGWWQVCVETWFIPVVYLGEKGLSHIVNIGIEHGFCKRLNTREEPGSSDVTAKSNSIHKNILSQHPTNKSSSLGNDAF